MCNSENLSKSIEKYIAILLETYQKVLPTTPSPNK